jgi:hypothetical protein
MKYYDVVPRRWMAVCAMVASCIGPVQGIAMETAPGLKHLRCVQLDVAVEQDPAVQSRFPMIDESLQRNAASALRTALPLLSISQQCDNRLRLVLVLHDISNERMEGYNGLLITGIERVATVMETGKLQHVEVWSGGIQEFRGPLERASATANHALSRALKHFTEAYHLSGNP